MKDPASAPVRTCVGCGQREVQASLLRLQLRAAGELVVVGRSTAGRSAYVHPRAACVAGLARSKALGRSLRATIDRPERGRAVERLAAVVTDAAAGAGKRSGLRGDQAAPGAARR